MSTTLRDFIANREGEIKDLMKALKAELRELQVAKGALDAQQTSTPATQASGPTIKDMARFVLGTDFAKDGLTSAEILVGIKTEFDRDIDRTSLSPQLSRLKADDEIALEGEKWFSKQHYSAHLSASYDALVSDWNAPVQEEEDDGIPF